MAWAAQRFVGVAGRRGQMGCWSDGGEGVGGVGADPAVGGRRWCGSDQWGNKPWGGTGEQRGGESCRNDWGKRHKFGQCMDAWEEVGMAVPQVLPQRSHLALECRSGCPLHHHAHPP